MPLLCGLSYRVPYASVKAVLDQPSEQLPVELRNPTEAKWKAWSQQEDKAIRARLQRGELDSMVNLLLYGTSFTKRPRIKVESLTEASRAGILQARVRDLVTGLGRPGDNERLVFLNGLLRSMGVDPTDAGQTGVFIYNNLQRVLQEMTKLSESGQQATHLADAADIFNWRPGMLRDRGVSLDTSIFPDFSIEQALRDLKSRGVLREGQVARVAVIGPGLDFSDKNEAFSYDYYPQQTLQPFALYDSLLRLRLAKASGLDMSIFDVSSRVISHIESARQRAKMNAGYVIQLPRGVGNPWPPDLIRYWQSLGDQIGAEVTPIRPPVILRSANGGQSLEARAIRVRPEVVLRFQPGELNIVLERIDMTEADRFDLMVGTNIFIYYDAFERSLALENAGTMLKHGGLLLTNDRLPEVPGGTMRLGGLSDTQDSHDPVGWYRKE